VTEPKGVTPEAEDSFLSQSTGKPLREFSSGLLEKALVAEIYWVIGTQLKREAMMKKQVKKVKKVKQGVPAKAQSLFPLHEANNLRDVKRLIEAGADVNAKDYDGMTPLNSAASRGFFTFFPALRDAGADVNTKDNAGMTPLHWAAYLGHIEVVQILLSLGADINAKTNSGSTPLHIATPSCHSLLEAAQKKAQEKPQEDGYTAALVEASHSLFTATSKMLKANLDAHAVESMVILPLIEQAREVERKVEALIAARRSDR